MVVRIYNGVIVVLEVSLVIAFTFWAMLFEMHGAFV